MNDTLRVELLAQAVMDQIAKVEIGHCARVDFIGRAEVEQVSQQLLQIMPPKKRFAVHILTTTQKAQTAVNSLSITADRAIEIRNRKEQSLCLFIPDDLLEAGYSSIANSFALIDGRALYASVLRKAQRLLTQTSLDGSARVKAVFAQLRGMPGLSDERRLDFALTAYRHAVNGKLEQLGLELWRVGLIADARADFEKYLLSNRHCTLAIAKATRPDSTLRERVQGLKVDNATALTLGRFFRGRALQDSYTWSRALVLKQGLTFERWVFVQLEQSDMRDVRIKPFLDKNDKVERYCHLIQPDGPMGSLRARYGSKETMVVKWECEPAKPNKLHNWHVGIVPFGSEDGFERCLLEQHVQGSRRTVTIKLDLDLDEPPTEALCVRVVPLSADGSEIVSAETNKSLVADSTEFLLVKEIETPIVEAPTDIRHSVSSIALGRIEVLMTMGREGLLEESEPSWNADYFSLRLGGKSVLNVRVSHLLLALEQQLLSAPRDVTSFVLNIDEVRPASKEECFALPSLYSEQEAWSTFWRQRELFFKRVSQHEARGVIEAANWSEDLPYAAIRYAQAYRELIGTLLIKGADAEEVCTALAVDTLLVRITNGNDQTEEALVVLPTHPLRCIWFANYMQLLKNWEQKLVALAISERKQYLDMQALRLLSPMNVPAFAHHPATETIFTFFQNVCFFHGVAFPASVPDPHRRYGDIAQVLGAGFDALAMMGDIQPEKLTEHLLLFKASHPYATTMVATLINPDRGNFFAEAMRQLQSKSQPTAREQEDETGSAQKGFLQVIAYSEDTSVASLQALESIRQQQNDLAYHQRSDYFLPGLTTVSHGMHELALNALPEAHIAVVTDYTHPTMIATRVQDEEERNELGSFALYGLINRFIATFSVRDEQLIWRHQIVTGVKKPDPHPAGSQYSKTLIDLHTAVLNASGYLLAGEKGMRPVLEVHLEREKRLLLERLHEKTNWVVTLDRFFTLDYYDSPNEPGLERVARKYVLDYAPELTEGLGHRMMVTTAWHEEISSLLARAMNELGFSAVEQSVSNLLHYLKTISGKLALQALESTTNASAAVGLGVVTAWLQAHKRLRQAVLLPVDSYPRIFSLTGSGRSEAGERRCDLVLIALKRNIVEATFIEVKWRTTNGMPLEPLARDMLLQMKASEQIMRLRFFDERRVDGALQRSYLANVLRFYFERSRRYGLFDPESEAIFLEHIARLEKAGLDFKPTYEGYIVNLTGEPGRVVTTADAQAKITVLTSKDFENMAEFAALLSQEQPASQPSVQQPQTGDNDDDEDEKVRDDFPLAEPLTNTVNTAMRADRFTWQEGDLNFVKVHKLVETVEEDTTWQETLSMTQKLPSSGEVVVPLGESAESMVHWRPSVKGSPHLFILGIPGQGKSWTTIRLLSELGAQQVPALVLDFHGQFADPQGDFVRTVHPTVLDAARGLPFSPFECKRDAFSLDWKTNAFEVAEIIAYVAKLGIVQRDDVYKAIAEAYRAHGFRDSMSEVEARDVVYPTLEEVSQRLEYEEQRRHGANVMARCRPLFDMHLFRPDTHGPSLLSLLRDGLVIDLHHLKIEDVQLAAGAFVLRKLYRDMFQWGPADRLRLVVVLDEAHRLAKDVTLPKIMKEGRKFGVAVVVASQGLNDFHPDILGNVGSKIIFRMNYPESKKASGFIRAYPGQNAVERIEQLSVGSAYVQTPEMSHGAVVKMYPLEM